MKNLKLIIVGLLAVSLGSCDIERNPFQDVADEQVFNSELGLESAALGSYAILKQNTFMRPYHFHGEYGGDNISLSGATSDALYYMYNFQHVKDNYHLNSLWVDSYKAIVNSNKIIEATAEGKSERMDHVLGENYYLRAFFYFTLTNIWGRPYSQDPTFNLGVPLKLNADINNIPPRATVAEVYEQIVKDLEKAAQLMSRFHRSDDEFRIYASQEAAWALLSRVYLYMENNDKAIEYATKVIDSGRFTLLQGDEYTKYPTFVPEANLETIFACRSLKDEDDYNWYAVGGMYAYIDGVGWGEMYASEPYRDLLAKNLTDLRNKFIDPQYIGTNEMWVSYTKKLSTSQEINYTHYDAYKNETDGKWYFTDGDWTDEIYTEVSGTQTLYYIMEYGEKTYVRLERKMEQRNSYPKYYVNKCSKQEGQAQLWSPVISRLAEMYLNRAEAYAKKGNDGLALADVNVIRNRAQIPVYSSVPANSTSLDVVLEERRLELAFEAHRRYDIFRNGLTLDRNYPGTHGRGAALMQVPANHPRVVEFIPETQILAQPNLVQNQ